MKHGIQKDGAEGDYRLTAIAAPSARLKLLPPQASSAAGVATGDSETLGPWLNNVSADVGDKNNGR